MAKPTTRGEQAIHAIQKAHHSRNLPSFRPTDGHFNARVAERAQAEADELLKPPGELVRGCGEVVCSDTDGEVQQWLVDTLREPNMIAVGASEQRLEAASKAGVLEAAVDAAQSAKAANSLEKMLCHQMAAAHHAGMTLLTRSIEARMPPLEAARLSNAAARMMEMYQQGLLTLQKLRTGGKQTVVVQHVQVADGGQAVIAGNVGPNGVRRRER
jgi:hypothetical protein